VAATKVKRKEENPEARMRREMKKTALFDIVKM
jgi:hypothetical protein